MEENGLTRKLNVSVYTRDSKTITPQRLVNIDNGEQSGTHWTCFQMKNIFFDSIEVSPEKISPEQVSKSIVSDNYNIQNINTRLCGLNCSYFD